MQLLVLGGGMMGRAAAYDMARQPDVDLVTVADVNRGAAEDAAELAARQKTEAVVLDVTDRAAVETAMRGADAALSCVSYRFNLELAEVAAETGTHFVDLGGNNKVVEGELALDEPARKTGATLVPDCGLAPGMVSILAMRGVEQMDEVESVRMRVGGLPAHPEPPLDYMIVFSVHGLVNEYIEPCLAIRDGRLIELPGMSEVEEVEFPEPFGTMEAFNTSGGSSTLPHTLLGRVRELDYKTIRYPGHAEKVSAMLDIGLASDDPIMIAGVEVAPRDVLEACLERSLTKDDQDLVLLRVTVDGRKDGETVRASFDMMDHFDHETGLSAMMRGTSFPASIITLMAARGELPPGAHRQELVVPGERFIEEFVSRGMPLETDFGRLR